MSSFFHQRWAAILALALATSSSACASSDDDGDPGQDSAANDTETLLTAGLDAGDFDAPCVDPVPPAGSRICAADARAHGLDGCGPSEIGGEWECVLAALRDGVPGVVEIDASWPSVIPGGEMEYCGVVLTYTIYGGRRATLKVDTLGRFDRIYEYEIELAPPAHFEACLNADSDAIRECLVDLEQNVVARVCCGDGLEAPC